ncbi:MAG: DUF3536 domain-containing protein [candidate division KSB1 bacterium]|nr:DUF3536 domain-containing protein [candidate division KSB1 bacterium]MDZ7317511.1 DUF3536 domain-containing protein [candidate division KSB1 bacterium]MDZ7342506.1 DUF3536 domain-containing protein [candidate division KSB1 bacterium]
MQKNLFFVIHGHFYQPPRENPSIEEIERQDSAAPYHDWNEKIAAQCYTPNAASRILDRVGRIEDIVDNYQRISFNFGPTLLSWLERKVPETYAAILTADRKSVDHFSGHGNAIAQAYNHIILPLANARDKATQIRWGLADFEFRFRRPAEAIWLPETAINAATLAALIDASIRFIILSPYQAQRVRPLNVAGNEPWQDVSDGSIDVSRSYRCFLKKADGTIDKNKSVDVFFYHAGLARAVGFEHILRDAKVFAQLIQQSYNPQSGDNQLISVCTDGESYGHHEPFGDMALAYLLHREVPRRDLRLTNYAEFLELNPPQWEVELKDGPNGEGTAWSCFHGVGRWYRDCGCHASAPAGWNQKWRTPLRTALDVLRDDLIQLYEDEGAKWLRDVWAARNDYIRVVLQRDPKTIHEFLEQHGSTTAIFDHQVEVLNLLEMQRNAMLMYTSCGWFFNDISGIETVQILRYAAQAIALAQSFGKDELEHKFLDQLKRAKSNLPQFRDGAHIYQTMVKPSLVTFPKIAYHFALLSSIKKYETADSVYHFKIEHQDKQKLTLASSQATLGKVAIVSGLTFEKYTYCYLLHDSGQLDGLGYIKFIKTDADFEQLKNELQAQAAGRKSQFEKYLRENWTDGRFSLVDALFEEREDFFQLLFHDQLEQLHQVYHKIFTDNQRLLEILFKKGFPIPAQLKIPAETTMSRELLTAVKNASNHFDKAFYKRALALVEKAHAFGFELDTSQVTNIFDQTLQERMDRLYRKPERQLCMELVEILEIANHLKLKINDGRLQNVMFKLLTEKLPPMIDQIIANHQLDTQFELVTSLVQLAYRLNFSTTIYKQQLRDIEKKISDDPRYWP